MVVVVGTHRNVRPGVYLLLDGSEPFDLAKNIHLKLADNYFLAIDVKTVERSHQTIA